jgi:Flp pilus assembly protein TadG
MIRTTKPQKRRAAALVEFAFVAIISMLFLFGIFEYARFVFFLQVANNAAREGARFAVVHTGDGTTTTDIINQVNDRMANRQSELTGYTVTVTNVSPATGVAVGGTTWQDSAFSQAIMVRIQGQYRPILPSFLGLPSTINVDVKSMMTSETN